MKKILISAAMLFSTFMYSQIQKFTLYENFCELEVLDWNKGGWVQISPDTCYAFFMNDNQDMFVIQNYSDSTDVAFYRIYETQNKLFDWKYKSRNEQTKEDIYINYTKDSEYTMLRIDLPKYSFRYKKKED
jgi:hypothetical protein